MLELMVTKFIKDDLLKAQNLIDELIQNEQLNIAYQVINKNVVFLIANVYLT